MTKIKICGITRLEDARFCTELGADFIGFIFVPSTPRYIEPEKAAEIVREIANGGKSDTPWIVGVFRDVSVEYLRQIVEIVGIDFVQLHGSESDETIQALDLPVIKTYRVGDVLPDTTAAGSAAWLLFDTFDDRRVGGTGRRFDWSLLASYSRAKPFFLAGGLGPDNVGAAISAVRPDAIDVSSGVESGPGVKDHEKLRQLFERVRRS